MWTPLLAVSTLLSLALPSTAQLSLPNPPYLPPNATVGAQPSLGGYPNRHWTNLLGSLLYFYEAQRSGNLPVSNRVSWRNSSAISDGRDADLDLSGGYYDAGDYIKATFPLSFTLMSICWGATDFGHGYDLSNQTTYLDDMLRWGLGWLMKAHPNDTTLYVLVGDPDKDNAYWGGDRNIPTPRPVFHIDAANPGTDVAAGTAAAFAACSNLYSNKGFNNTYSSPANLTDNSYADTLLTHASSLYSFAVNATGGRKVYQRSVPAVADAYASSDYGDELAIAALFLARATNSQDMFDQAETHWTKYDLDNQNRVFNWDSKAPGLPILFTQVLRSSSFSGNVSDWQSKAETYLDKIVERRSPGRMTRGGLLYYNGDSDSASLNPALNAAMLMTRYAPYTSSFEKRAAYINFAQSQLNYALGNNSMSGKYTTPPSFLNPFLLSRKAYFSIRNYSLVPYVVGVNPNSPSNPHSAMAHGGNNISAIDTDPERTTYTLYGAVIGGPDINDNYFDLRSDWPQTEVALDYNAPLLTLTAYNIMQTTVDPYYVNLAAGTYARVKPTGLPCDAAFRQGCPNPELSPGAKVAMALCVTITGLVLFGMAAYMFVLQARRPKL